MIYFHYLLYSIAIVYVVSLFCGKRKKMVFLSVSGVLLTLFLGLRDVDSGGIDLLRYYYTYDLLQHANSIESAFEIREGENSFFFALMFILAKLGCSYQLFLFLVAALSVSASLLLYYRYSEYPLLCVSMFLPICYSHLFSQLKQTVAVSIAIFAYMMFRKNKLFATYAILTIAIFFHPTAIVMIPFFILSRYRANPLLIAILFLGSLFIFLLRMQIGYILTLAFYEQHLDTWESTESITGMAILFMLITSFYLFIMPKRREASKEKYLILSSYLYLLIIAMSIFFCSSYSFGFTRLNNYFMVFVPLAFSEIAEFNLWKRTVNSKYPIYAAFGVIIIFMINRFLEMVVSMQLELFKFYWMN